MLFFDNFSSQFTSTSRLSHNIYLLGRVKANSCLLWDTWSQRNTLSGKSCPLSSACISSQKPVTGEQCCDWQERESIAIRHTQRAWANLFPSLSIVTVNEFKQIKVMCFAFCLITYKLIDITLKNVTPNLTYIKIHFQLNHHANSNEFERLQFEAQSSTFTFSHFVQF